MLVSALAGRENILAAYNEAHGTTDAEWAEFKAQHVLIVGKDALTKSGLTGEDSAKMYVKAKGSADGCAGYADQP